MFKHQNPYRSWSVEKYTKENSIYYHCDSNTIGDEYHYFFVRFNEQIMSLRERYVPTYNTKDPSQFKFTGLLSHCDVPVLTKVCMFVRHIEKINFHNS